QQTGDFRQLAFTSDEAGDTRGQIAMRSGRFGDHGSLPARDRCRALMAGSMAVKMRLCRYVQYTTRRAVCWKSVMPPDSCASVTPGSAVWRHDHGSLWLVVRKVVDGSLWLVVRKVVGHTSPPLSRVSWHTTQR